MRYSLIFALLLSMSSLQAVETMQDDTVQEYELVSDVLKEDANDAQTKLDKDVDSNVGPVLSEQQPMVISVVGQGVAPSNTQSPAQAYALAKRAAIADAYRMIAEKVKGVRVDGKDLIKNMMVKRSTVRTAVYAMVRNANVVETIFKDGLCEVEMEITLSHADFAR
ncbi:LPP20 family lipoprotein [Sulfurimonas sp.]|uniref:LPP20 family lipoprotein n=1 Tax=Sulfurimonas sp. TaxID=2022749 RepID=UPI0035682B02